MTSRPTLLIADSHLGQEPGDEGPMIELLERVDQDRFSAVYLLGDAFHYLIGERKYMTPAIDRAMVAFSRVVERGVPVHYVEGNRDFYIKDSFLAGNFSSIDLAFVLETPTGKVFMTHGDLINDRDYKYRFWRFMSKNPLTHVAMKAVPKRRARQLVSGMEGRLKKSNFKHKRRLPEEKIIDFAKKRWTEGDRTVLLGHFHVDWRHEAGDGREVAVVPAWCESDRVALIDTQGTYQVVARDQLWS